MRVNKMHLLISHIDVTMEGRLICYYANASIQDLFYGIHVRSPIEVKVMWFKV